MSVRRLAQGTVNLIQDYLQTNMPAALDAVNADTTVLNTTPHMALENIKSFFVYPQAAAFSAPAIFIIMDQFDFNIDKNKSNFVNATAKVNVSVVLEDQDSSILTYKCYRYQSALHAVLDEATIKTSDNKLQIKVIVYRATFSDLYQSKHGPGQFRKEVVMQCEVLHTENF